MIKHSVLAHRQNSSGSNFHRYRSCAQVPFVIDRHLALYHLVGSVLQFDVHGRVNLKPSASKQGFAVFDCKTKLRRVSNSPNYVVAEVSSLLICLTTSWRLGDVWLNRLGLICICFCRGYVTLASHVVDDIVATDFCNRQILWLIRLVFVRGL